LQVCADAGGGGAFTGLVDEIQLFDYVVPRLTPTTHLTYAWPAGDDAAAPAAWATLDFKAGVSPVQEERAVATATGALQVGSLPSRLGPLQFKRGSNRALRIQWGFQRGLRIQ
jgi:hypothetical protein